MIRNRAARDPLKVVKQLDAFPKTPEECKSTSEIGGILSIISRIMIVYLIYIEIKYYMDSKIIFKFVPDTDMDTKLTIHIDLTVAMPCRSIGADILDSTNQNVFSFGVLQEDDTWWQMSKDQEDYFNSMKHFNDYLREEYHSLQELIYKHNRKFSFTLPEREDKLNQPYDACRIHGKLTLNKVAGYFHITGGKSLHFPQGHLHISSMFDDTRRNFSHRINRFSFGLQSIGIINPLDGDEKIFDDSSMICQYYVEVVPTDIETFLSNTKTFQYSVRENVRPIDHDKGSHGIPGIYVKYDVSALKVLVTQDREHVLHLIVRLCSVTAGIIVISGMVNGVIQTIINWILPIIAPAAYQRLQSERLAQQSMATLNIPRIEDVVTDGGGGGTVTVAQPSTTLKNNNLLLSASLTPEILCDFTVKQL